MLHNKMRIPFIILLSLISIWTFGQELENNTYNNKYYYDNNRLYGPDSNTYTGKFMQFHPGSIKVNGDYVNGLKDGTFYIYDSDKQHGLIGVEKYSNGLKNGQFKNYNKGNTWIRNLISIENYTSDTLKEAYYWDRSGQLTKTFINNQTKTYSIDTSIWSIITYIKGQFAIFPAERLKPYYGIKEKYFCSNDSIKLLIAKITCTDCWEFGMDIKDTVILEEYKVLSFSVDYNVLGDLKPGYKIIGNTLPKNVRMGICNFIGLSIWISDIVIVDKNNIEYYLSDTKYMIEE